MRELAGRESERRSREEEQMRFIAEDAREFAAGIRRRISRGWTLRRAFAVSAAAATAESR